jgi:NAD-dependent DNA ligase
MKQRLEARGYLVPDNLTKDTNYLIAAKMGSGKCQKAEKYGIPIIPLIEADDFINSL